MLITALLLHIACATETPAGHVLCAPVGSQWRNHATQDDRRRLREWRSAFLEAIDQARRAGQGQLVDSEGDLLEPDAALAGGSPPPGDYRCRVIKIGSQREEGLAFVQYPAFQCRIHSDDAGLTLVKLSGSQRPVGHLFPDGDRHLVFLGTLQLGDERRSHRYGVDRERNLAGRFERFAPDRWRLVLPYPHFESLLDVIEFVPSSPTGEG